MNYNGIIKALQYLTLSYILFIALSTAALADIPSVVTIEIKDQQFEIVELVEHYNRWYKHEPEYWKYKLLNSEYPLTIYKTDYVANKFLLKYVPDHRDFYTKHPHVQKVMFIGNMASLTLNILQLVKI